MNAFLTALQNKASTLTPKQTGVIINPTLPPELKPKPSDKIPMQLRVELIASHNRIDLFFSEIPDKDLRQLMKDAGFWFNPTSKAWYNKDTENNRQFCRDTFGAEIEQYQGIPLSQLMPTLDAPKIIVPEPVQEPTKSFELLTIPVPPEFERFKEQTNQLLEQLKIDPADLMLIAIDCLHRETFGGNTPKN